VPRLRVFWSPPEMGTPPLPWAAWSKAWPRFQERTFSRYPIWTSPDATWGHCLSSCRLQGPEGTPGTSQATSCSWARAGSVPSTVPAGCIPIAAAARPGSEGLWPLQATFADLSLHLEREGGAQPGWGTGGGDALSNLGWDHSVPLETVQDDLSDLGKALEVTCRHVSLLFLFYFEAGFLPAFYSVLQEKRILLLPRASVLTKSGAHRDQPLGPFTGVSWGQLLSPRKGHSTRRPPSTLAPLPHDTHQWARPNGWPRRPRWAPGQQQWARPPPARDAPSSARCCLGWGAERGGGQPPALGPRVTRSWAEWAAKIFLHLVT